MADIEIGKKAVAYVRVSSETQVQNGHGLQSQETACREFAKAKGLEVINIFSDGGVSGKYMARDALDAMLLYLKTENKNYTKISYVIVDDMDRVSRDVVGRWSLKTAIESSGTILLSLKQNLENNPEGKLQQNIVMSFKQYEREANSRRVKDRQRSRMLDGYRPLYSPPGYIHTKGENGKKVLELQEPDASIIKDALELFASGMFPTKEELRKYLLDQGFRSRRGQKVFRSFTDRLLDEQRLWFYAGYIEYKHWDVKMIKAKHTALIDQNIVYKIIERLNPKVLYKKYTYSEIDIKMPLRSVVLCDCCGYPLTGGPSKSHTGKHYFYYSCRQAGCSSYGKSFSADKLHTDFENIIDTLKIKDSVIELIKASATDFYKDASGNLEKQDASTKKEVYELDKLIDQIQDRILGTTDSKIIPLYEKRLREYVDKKNVLDSKLSSGSQTQHSNLGELIEGSKEMLINPVSVWKDADVENKRLFVKVLFNNNLTYGKISGIGTPEIPLIYRDFSLLGSTNSYLVEIACKLSNSRFSRQGQICHGNMYNHL